MAFFGLNFDGDTDCCTIAEWRKGICMHRNVITAVHIQNISTGRDLKIPKYETAKNFPYRLRAKVYLTLDGILPQYIRSMMRECVEEKESSF